MVKFWAFIYRHTGWYSPFAMLAEYNHVKKHLPSSYGVLIGLWQADNGFTLTSAQAERYRAKRKKRLLKRKK